MPALRLWWLLGWSLWLIGPAAAAQGPPTPAGLDGDGDPLPTAARLRVGTKRWRHGREATSLVWTPDGKQLAFISDDQIRVVDGETGKLLRVIAPQAPGETIRPVGLAIAPDGRELAERSGGRIFAFEWATAKHLRTFESKLDDFGDDGGLVSYSLDGKYLAFAEGVGYAVFDRKTGEAIVKEDTRAEIQGVQFTRDSTRLVVASLKPSLKVWDLAKREIAHRWSFSDECFVWGPGVSPDGKLVAVGLSHVEVVDPVAGDVKAQLHGDNAKDLFLQLEFTPDGRQLVAASQEGQVYVWKTADWSRQFKLTSDCWIVRSMAIRPDGKRLAVGDARHRVWVWNLQTGELLFNDRPGHDPEVQAIAFTPDGRTLITGSGARDTHFWSARSGEHLRLLNTSSSSLAVTPDGRQLLTSWYGGPQLRTWDLETGKQATEWTAPEAPIRKFVLAAEQPLMALLFDIDEPRRFRLLRRRWPELAEAGEVQQEGYTRGALAISADGRLVAIAPIGSVQLRSFPAGQLAVELPNPNHYCDNLLFSRDGRFVFGTNSDKSVLVWEVASGRLVHALTGHLRVPAAMALAPNGRMLATAGGSRSFPVPAAAPHQIRFWDILAGEQVASLSGHDENVCALAFSPDGKLLASGLRDTTALVWDVPETVQAARPSPPALSRDEAEALWKQLAADDAKQGQAAVLRLSHNPKQTLSLAAQRLTPVQPVKLADIERLIARLDSEEFRDRSGAYEQLTALGATIAPQLRKAVEQATSAEIKLQCAKLLQGFQRRYPQQGQRLAETRAVQLLEQIGYEPSRALLVKLAGGAAEAHLTEEAQAAMQRLSKPRAAR